MVVYIVMGILGIIFALYVWRYMIVVSEETKAAEKTSPIEGPRPRISSVGQRLKIIDDL